MFGRASKKDDKALLADRLQKVSGAPVFRAEGASAPAVRTFRATCRSERQPTFRDGSLKLSAGETEPVVVKNVSKTGARVDYPRRLTLPDRVFLSAPSLGVKAWARVIWREEHAAGLEFEAS